LFLTIWNAIILNEIIEIHIPKSRELRGPSVCDVTTPAHRGKALDLQGLHKTLSYRDLANKEPFKDIKAIHQLCLVLKTLFGSSECATVYEAANA